MSDFENKNLRNKDNAAPRVKPPRSVRIAPKGFAPPGMSGVKPSIPTGKTRLKSGLAPKSKKRFALGKSGELKKEFKPLVSKAPDKGCNFER